MSKLGGRPDLPAGMDCPVGKVGDQEIALPSVAQLKVADLHLCDIEGALPSQACCSSSITGKLGSRLLSPENWRVICHNAEGKYVASSPPKPIPRL
jgi:hypothetical protein